MEKLSPFHGKLKQKTIFLGLITLTFNDTTTCLYIADSRSRVVFCISTINQFLIQSNPRLMVSTCTIQYNPWRQKQNSTSQMIRAWLPSFVSQHTTKFSQAEGYFFGWGRRFFNRFRPMHGQKRTRFSHWLFVWLR
jgi:hypothetical protein